MQQAYEEVVNLAEGAVKTIEELTQARPSEASDYDKHHRWNKAAASVLDLFDISINANEAPKDQDKDATAALKEISDLFTTIKEHANDDTRPIVQFQRLRNKIFCGDKFAAYVKDGVQGPDGSVPVRNNNWWIDPGKNDEGVKPWWQIHTARNSKKPDAGWCNEQPPGTVPDPGAGEEAQELYAATNQLYHYVYFCKRILDKDATFGGATIQSAPSIAAARTGGQGTSLNSLESLSRTMLHEFVHLYDTNAKDKLAPKLAIGGKRFLKNDAGQYVEDDGLNNPGKVPRKIYGYNLVYVSARCFPYNSNGGYNKPAGGLKDKFRNLGTVDSYVMFAMSMKFPGYTFQGEFGRAVAIPPRP